MTPPTPENYFQFEKLLVELARAGVDLAVVGGVAVSLNGFVRATDDVDLSWASRQKISRRSSKLCRVGAKGGRENSKWKILSLRKVPSASWKILIWTFSSE